MEKLYCFPSFFEVNLCTYRAEVFVFLEKVFLILTEITLIKTEYRRLIMTEHILRGKGLRDFQKY